MAKVVPSSGRGRESHTSAILVEPRGKCSRSAVCRHLCRVWNTSNYGIHASSPSPSQRQRLSSLSAKFFPDSRGSASVPANVLVWRTSALGVLIVPGVLLIFAGLAKLLINMGTDKVLFADAMANQVEEFFPGEDYARLREKMQEIGPKFDMFFLVLYMTDWVRLAASTVCSIFAVFAYCKRFDYEASSKWARRAWLTGFVIPFALSLLLPYVTLVEWEEIHRLSCEISLAQGAARLRFPVFTETDQVMLSGNEATFPTVGYKYALQIEDPVAYCAKFDSDAWGQDLADRIQTFSNEQEKAFDPPSSHEAYCTVLVTKTLMGEHSLTANQVTALTGVDGATLIASSEYTSASSADKESLLVSSHDVNQDAATAQAACVKAVYLYPSLLSTLQIACSGLSKLVVSMKGLVAITMALRTFFQIGPLVLSLLSGIYDAATNFKTFVPHTSASGFVIVGVPMIIAPYIAAYCGVIIQLFGDVYVTLSMLMLVGSCFVIGFFKSVIKPMNRMTFVKKMNKANIPITLLRATGIGLLVAGVLVANLVQPQQLLQGLDVAGMIPGVLVILFNTVFKTLLSTLVGLDSMVSLSLQHFASEAQLEPSVGELNKALFQDLLLLKELTKHEPSRSPKVAAASKHKRLVSIEDLYPQANADQELHDVRYMHPAKKLASGASDRRISRDETLTSLTEFET